MLELVFVIVIVGILAAVLIPKMGQSRLREAADQVVSHIRYTQHLAIIDDNYNSVDENWTKKRWQIVFGSSAKTNYQLAYTVFSDTAGGSTGNPDRSEIAKNPMDRSKILSYGTAGDVNYKDKDVSKELNLGGKYGITNVIFSNSCTVGGSRRVIFDYIGRPMKGRGDFTSAYPANSLITQTCTITLRNNANENIDITIEPETGYASVGQIY